MTQAMPTLTYCTVVSAVACCFLADVNDTSRQLTSHQKRCSEVADNAGIVRKRWATALTTAQYIGVGIAWVVLT